MEEYKPVNQEREKEIPKVDLSKITNPFLKQLIDAGLITEQGLRVQGVGILIRKMEKTIDMIDKTNLKIWGLSKDLQKYR